MNGTDGGSVLSLREKKRGLDAVWLTTWTVAFVTVAVPWYLRALEIDLAPVAWGLFGAALAYLAAAFGTDRLRRRRALAVATGIAQIAGLALLAVAWHLAGGLENPLFLLVFALPVAAGALLLPRGQSTVTAGAAVAAVLAVAWMESSDLRWYVLTSGLPAHRLADLLPELSLRTSDPFPSLEVPPGYLFVLVLAFAVFVPALAWVLRALTRAAARLERQDAVRGAGVLFREALEASPWPAALVASDSARVVASSAGFRNHLLLEEEDPAGRDLFELVAFEEREAVERLFAGSGGELASAAYRVGPETRAARVRAYPVAGGGDRYVWVGLEDLGQP